MERLQLVAGEQVIDTRVYVVGEAGEPEELAA